MVGVTEGAVLFTTTVGAAVTGPIGSETDTNFVKFDLRNAVVRNVIFVSNCAAVNVNVNALEIMAPSDNH